MYNAVGEVAPPYQPIEGCELPALQPCVERWQMMQDWLPQRGRVRRMVDYGCHTGWFCREFSKAGWRTTGFDRAPDWIETAQSLNEHAGRIKPKYCQANVLDMSLPECEVALCLSLAMYLFDDVHAGWKFFNSVSLQSPIMFIDFGGQYANRLPFTEATVIEEMLKHTTYTLGRLLGHTAFESRPLFLFAR